MDAHESLLEKWSRRPQHAGECFIQDGIIDADRWARAKPRVALLLKEAYDEPGATAAQSWDLRKFLRETGPKWKIWWTAAYWCYAVRQLGSGNLPPFPVEEHDAKEALLSSAIVNIKKSGGRSYSDIGEITRVAKDDGLLIREQIDLINPQVVICGYTWECVKPLWPEPDRIYDLVWRVGERVFVDFWHPANYYPDQLNYYALAGVLQNSKALVGL